MNKVLVDRELLEEAAKWLEVHSPSSGSAEAFAAEALRDALAQPAEAEGVEVPVEGYILDNNGYSFTRRREDFWTAKAAIVPLVRQSDHLTALSAVTAERDAARTDLATVIGQRDCYANQVLRLETTVTAERDRLQGELDSLRWEIASPNISYALRDQLLGQLAGDHEPDEMMCVEDFYSWLAGAIDNIRAEHRKAEGSQPVRVLASAAMAAKEA